MSVVRVKRKNHFTHIPNAVLRDANLTLQAKGLLAAMLSYPDDWSYNLSHLEQQSINGRDAHRTALRELIDGGYAKWVYKHDGQKLEGRELIVSDEALWDSETDSQADTEAVGREISPTDNQSVGDPATTNTYSTKNESTKPPPSPPRQDEDDGVGLEQARRTPPRNSDKVQILMQRHPTTWHALGELASERGWGRHQFKAIAVTTLDLVRQHGEQQATAAFQSVLRQNDQIRNPIKYIEKALTDDRPREGRKKTKRLNLLEGTGVEP